MSAGWNLNLDCYPNPGSNPNQNSMQFKVGGIKTRGESRGNSAYVQTYDTQGRKEGNVVFNDALNTFYLRLYGDHSDSERGNPLPPHGLLFPISSKGSLYAPSHTQDSTYHGLCCTSRGALAGTRNSPMGPPCRTPRESRK